MHKIIRQRSWVKATLTRAFNNAQNLEQHTAETLRNRLEKIEEAYKDFIHLSQELYNYADEDGYEDPLESAEEYESKYFDTQALLAEALSRLTSVTSSPVHDANASLETFDRLAAQQRTFFDNLNESKHGVRLMSLNVPVFSGNYQDWTSFRDLFQSAIANKRNLTNVQKLQYLKSYLKGDALQTIKHLNITEDNYTVAWLRLEKRYDRKALIVQSYIGSFMSLPITHTENASVLRKICDGADEVVLGLDALGVNQRDSWLIHLLLNKVDNETKSAWADLGDGKTLLSFNEFLTFLSHRCDMLEAVPATRQPKKPVMAFHATSSPAKQFTCSKCSDNHPLYKCSQFNELDVNSRRDYVKKERLCFNCLSRGHHSSSCTSSYRCKTCNGKHHSSVHPNSQLSASFNTTLSPNNSMGSFVRSPEDEGSHTPNSTALTHHSMRSHQTSSQTLLPTALAKTVGICGQVTSCRMLLDSGSTVSFITEAMVQRLGLPRKNARVPVLGLSSCPAAISKGRVSLQLTSHSSSDTITIDALVLPTLTSYIPTQSVVLPSTWSQFSNLQLADLSFGVPGPIDVLIGSDFLGKIYTGERLSIGENAPVAMNTIFGWVIMGSCPSDNDDEPRFASSSHALINLDHIARLFMDSESINPIQIETKDDDPAEDHFVRTHTRDITGSYVLQYPFKDNMAPIADTLSQTVNRVHQMERRFKRDNGLKQQYVNFMHEYQALGHMELIPETELLLKPPNCFYLAHHAVLKPDSSTTKCRVVFDGSCKDAIGVSLNERLHIGPPIQRDLFGVALRFRQHQLVFAADIEKMFRGIRIAREHQDYQRIVWRENETDPLQHFRLLTVTYGLASSPFLAVRVLKQLALDYAHEFPVASQVLLNDVYVDDVLTGCSSIKDVLQLKDDLIRLLSKANFKLRKWSSNCWPLLDSLPDEICEYNPKVFDVGHDVRIKVLGLQWSPGKDELSLKIVEPIVTVPTKRILLSEMSKIYDPLGIVAPAIVQFKVLFQDSWYHGLGWDDKLPPSLATRWHQYASDLTHLAKIKLPRSIQTGEGFDIEIHGFADASSIACAAVVYTRMKVGDSFQTQLVAAKTRVAPLRPISIPRMELNAAVLLTRLISRVTTCISITIKKICCWTDSEIVLHWLSSPPRRWQTFVCNRVVEILETAPRETWRHVRSEDNPADCASRGLISSELINHTLWWHGPEWLAKHESAWPVQKVLAVPRCSEQLEEKKQHVNMLCIKPSETVIEDLIKRHSSWTRLLRVLTYCRRFIGRVRLNIIPTLTILTTLELAQAKWALLRYVQFKSFREDIQYLERHKSPCPKSKLSRFTPFLDKNGILRVGGRLKNSTLKYSMKFPILLPKESEVSLSIIHHTHVLYLHTGVDATFTIIRQQYWILGCRNMVRKVVFECKTCFLLRRPTSEQLMGDLPEARVREHRCFLHCGLDYAGPVSLKSSKGRNPKLSKAWFAIFVCLSTKAMHIELVSDLTSDAFLAAFRRFVARRGKPTDLYSDNGTTFHGSYRILNDLHKFALSQSNLHHIHELMANDGVTWHFIPPSAPHFGGLWEAGVRSIKLHLRRVIGTSTLTFEEYYTVLTQIEAILNSRPLCVISDDETDPLTPAHFLIGSPYTSVPEPNLLDENPNRLVLWRHLQAMVQGFWRRWHNEYLTSLQQRGKWQNRQPNLKVGDVVVLKEPNLPPAKWVMGKIETTTAGADGAVRVVTVKTTRGIYTRPIHKLARLPLS